MSCNLFEKCVSLPVWRLGAEPILRRLFGMITLANVLALMGMSAIRFGGRGGGGVVFMLFGLVVLGVVVWALTRPGGSDASRSGGQTGGSSPAARAPE
jgi:hypothetical protein